jgi:quaternary ammonium compound-resistance protein SugE
MNWLALIVAGFFEIVWVIGLKSTEGFSKFVPSVITGSAMAVSFMLLSYALRTIPVGTGYAVWTGIGACGALLYGMFFLGESRDVIRIACILVIVACIIVLKITHK